MAVIPFMVRVYEPSIAFVWGTSLHPSMSQLTIVGLTDLADCPTLLDQHGKLS